MAVLSEIWSSISRNKGRAALTGFAVAWGIFILVVLLGASNGLQHGIEQSFGSMASNAVSVMAGWTSKPYKGLPADRSMYFTLREAEMLRNLKEVERFSAVVQTNATASVGNQYSSVRLLGVEGDYQAIMRKEMVAGRFVNAYDQTNRSKVCVLDERTMQELSATTDIIGKYIKLGDVPFLVVGVCKNGDRWQGASIHIPLNTSMAIFATDKRFNQICMTTRGADLHVPKAKGDNRYQSSPFEQQIRDMLAPMMQFDPTDYNAIWIRNQQERIEQTGGVMAAIRLFVFIIGLCTLISGAVGVSNIMLVSVKERTKELGIRKAIGASPKTIIMTIVGESVLITALFGYIGMFLGIGVMEVINGITSGNSDIPFVNPTIDIPVVSIATAILILVGVIAGLIPALRAVRIKPIEAMRD